MAAGNKNVILASNGSFSVQLAPNSGATPAGVVYTVVYQLLDATVKTESWSVGTSSPETVAQVRAFVGTSTPSGQLATQQFVNSALANVVHLTGTETITGTKQFTVAPTVPTPTQSGQAVTKAYVDASVANVGAGNFVSKSGDTMSGPLILPADPTAPGQASTKHYVDVSSASKADLISGVVPITQLGSGTANNGMLARRLHVGRVRQRERDRADRRHAGHQVRDGFRLDSHQQHRPDDAGDENNFFGFLHARCNRQRAEILCLRLGNGNTRGGTGDGRNLCRK